MRPILRVRSLPSLSSGTHRRRRRNQRSTRRLARKVNITNITHRTRKRLNRRNSRVNMIINRKTRSMYRTHTYALNGNNFNIMLLRRMINMVPSMCGTPTQWYPMGVSSDRDPSTRSSNFIRRIRLYAYRARGTRNRGGRPRTNPRARRQRGRNTNQHGRPRGDRRRHATTRASPHPLREQRPTGDDE